MTVRKNHAFIRFVFNRLREEHLAWRIMLREEWVSLLVILIGVVLVIFVTRPLPSLEVTLAVGQPGSTTEQLGKRYQEIFAQEGVTLHLVNTAGSRESIVEADDAKTPINAGFLLGGIAHRGDFPHLVSLGSVQYLPLWLFYRGPQFAGADAISYFRGKPMAIGREGSGTELLLTRILAMRGVQISGENANLRRLSHADAIEQLLAGKIEGMAIVDGFDSPTIQNLLTHPELHIFDFAYADAYVKRMPYLETVVIPRGSLNLAKLDPPHDIHMIASTITLLVEKTMHPAIQQLFLLAADKTSEDTDNFFGRTEQFPAYIDKSIPLSDVAKRYYDKGAPWLTGMLPFWAVSYIDRMWLLVLGLFAIVLPLFRLIPNYRLFRSRQLISDAYDELKVIEERMYAATSVEQLRYLSERLEMLDAELGDVWVSSDETNRFYTMKSAIALVRREIGESLQRLSAAEHH